MRKECNMKSFRDVMTGVYDFLALLSFVEDVDWDAELPDTIRVK